MAAETTPATLPTKKNIGSWVLATALGLATLFAVAYAVGKGWKKSQA